MPLIRRIPKRGFNNTAFKTSYLPVNLSDLNTFENGTTVDEALLRKTGLAKGGADGVKILGTGTLTKKLNVRVSAFSASAKAAIEKLGGTTEVVA